MLTNSFVFFDGIGPISEKNIWNCGIHTWNDFLSTKRIAGISQSKKAFIDQQIHRTKNATISNNATFFSKIPLPISWRLYDEYKDDAVYLDIETADWYGNITVIGLFNGIETKIMVRGFNLDPKILSDELMKYKLIVTFNGASFDLPIIKRAFGEVIPKIPHIDLRGVCSKVGLIGGLKTIEREIGINRPEDITYVYGNDAVWLWHKFQETKDMKYLDILIRYNEEDIMNLKPLAKYAIQKLWKKTFFDSISQ